MKVSGKQILGGSIATKDCETYRNIHKIHNVKRSHKITAIFSQDTSENRYISWDVSCLVTVAFLRRNVEENVSFLVVIVIWRGRIPLIHHYQ